MTSRRGLAATAAWALAAVIVLGSCASLPSSGGVRVTGVQAAGGAEQQGIQFVPAGPGPSWTPAQIVNGFLVASASFANNHAVAREYLYSKYSPQWRPGWAATVVEQAPKINPVPVLPAHVTGGPAAAQVDLTSQHPATLQTAGKYGAGHLVVSSGSQVFHFLLIQVTGQWRIDGLYDGAKASPTLLLLTEPDFVRDYQPRNLYFIAPHSAADVLVPDPVFIPQQAGTKKSAAGLVKALLRPKAGWLLDATTTAFPAGTTLVGLQVSGIKAVIDLGGNAVKASAAQQQQMAAQLVWSLTGSSYGTPTTIRSVVLQVNHKEWRPKRGQSLQLLKDFASWVPASPASPVYFQSAGGVTAPGIRVLRTGDSAPGPVSLPRGFGGLQFSAIAVSPDSAGPPAFAGCRGKNVYVAPLLHGSRVSMQTLPATCESLSWDGRGNLWAAGRDGIWMLPGADTGDVDMVITVEDPALSPSTVTSLRVAPDGVRVAMIVQTKAGAKVMVAAISQPTARLVYLAESDEMVTVGSDISSPVALSWWDRDHLLVLGRNNGTAQLYDVPLNGQESKPVVTPAAAMSVATSGSGLVVGTATAGHARGETGADIWTSDGLNGLWRQVAHGISPVFPG